MSKLPSPKINIRNLNPDIYSVLKKEAEKNINLFLESVEESLVKGDEVTFVGWGKWEVVERAAREVRSPQSKEIIKVPAKKAVKFKVGKLLADKIK